MNAVASTSAADTPRPIAAPSRIRGASLFSPQVETTALNSLLFLM